MNQRIELEFQKTSLKFKENYYVIDKVEFNVSDFPTAPIYFK